MTIAASRLIVRRGDSARLAFERELEGDYGETNNKREVLTDVRTGMSDSEIMSKYRVSARGLESIFNKLMDAGVIDQKELDSRVDLSERTVALDLYKCPACGMGQFFPFDVCPQCGITVSKHQAPQAAAAEPVTTVTQVANFRLVPSRDGKTLTIEGLDHKLQKKMVDVVRATLTYLHD